MSTYCKQDIRTRNWRDRHEQDWVPDGKKVHLLGHAFHSLFLSFGFYEQQLSTCCVPDPLLSTVDTDVK